jgi:histidine kinase
MSDPIEPSGKDPRTDKDAVDALIQTMEDMKAQIARNEEALNRQIQEYRRLFEMVPCEIAVLDRQFRLINYNQRFARKFRPRLGEYCFRAYKGREQKCDRCPVEKTFQDGLSHHSEESGCTKNGQIAHWLVVTAPRKDESGRVVAAMEMTVDLTELKLAEGKLAASEKKYRDIFENIPNPVFVVARESFTILDCNNSVRSVYRYEKSDLLGTSFLDLFDSAELEHFARRMRTAAEIHRARHVTGTDRPIFVNIRISPSEYDGQHVLLVTTSDITKRLEAEQQLIQASKMATLGEMATGVAHELNQPLSVIKTASSFLMKKIRQGAAIDEKILYTMASEIDSHIQRATRIINHMREFGRKPDLQTEMTHVNTVIEKAFDIFSQQLKLRGIDVIWQLSADLPAVRSDPGKLEQVLINLLVNARDALEERWPPSAGPEEKKIRIRTRLDNGWVVIAVEDSGKGIPSEIRDKIFEPFFTTKDVGKGTGLGLSISYSIIQEYGGTIHVESGETGGARFVIRFPAAESHKGQRNGDRRADNEE